MATRCLGFTWPWCRAIAQLAALHGTVARPRLARAHKPPRSPNSGSFDVVWCGAVQGEARRIHQSGQVRSLPCLVACVAWAAPSHSNLGRPAFPSWHVCPPPSLPFPSRPWRAIYIARSRLGSLPRSSTIRPRAPEDVPRGPHGGQSHPAGTIPPATTPGRQISWRLPEEWITVASITASPPTTSEPTSRPCPSSCPSPPARSHRQSQHHPTAHLRPPTILLD
ncbi:hypothetical protein BS50DRAFT_232612 [Corynespora cassiicola Philippines]|uniref:Secreted protein n=1 Tax=Corynespora cassiicola Philippines TaxID=1448308 RepID=A0A2T2P1Y3_CORCC|nr:hypothetical protein BS50DRAFT_232612 [Corynespora cassiicola Philippines]